VRSTFHFASLLLTSGLTEIGFRQQTDLAHCYQAIRSTSATPTNSSSRSSPLCGGSSPRLRLGVSSRAIERWRWRFRSVCADSPSIGHRCIATDRGGSNGQVRGEIFGLVVRPWDIPWRIKDQRSEIKNRHQSTETTTSY